MSLRTLIPVALVPVESGQIGRGKLPFAQQKPVERTTNDTPVNSQDIASGIDSDGSCENGIREINGSEFSAAQQPAVVGPPAVCIPSDNLPGRVESVGIGEDRSGEINRREGHVVIPIRFWLRGWSQNAQAGENSWQRKSVISSRDLGLTQPARAQRLSLTMRECARRATLA
jgi:hypothetical protein